MTKREHLNSCLRSPELLFRFKDHWTRVNPSIWFLEEDQVIRSSPNILLVKTRITVFTFADGHTIRLESSEATRVHDHYNFMWDTWVHDLVLEKVGSCRVKGICWSWTWPWITHLLERGFWTYKWSTNRKRKQMKRCGDLFFPPFWNKKRRWWYLSLLDYVLEYSWDNICLLNWAKPPTYKNNPTDCTTQHIWFCWFQEYSFQKPQILPSSIYGSI